MKIVFALLFVCDPVLPDPTHVIGMYPDLLPSDYKKQLQYPNPVPLLSGAELEKANLALIDYLTQVRRSIGETIFRDPRNVSYFKMYSLSLACTSIWNPSSLSRCLQKTMSNNVLLMVFCMQCDMVEVLTLEGFPINCNSVVSTACPAIVLEFWNTFLYLSGRMHALNCFKIRILRL